LGCHVDSSCSSKNTQDNFLEHKHQCLSTMRSAHPMLQIREKHLIETKLHLVGVSVRQWVFWPPPSNHHVDRWRWECRCRGPSKPSFLCCLPGSAMGRNAHGWSGGTVAHGMESKPNHHDHVSMSISGSSRGGVCACSHTACLCAAVSYPATQGWQCNKNACDKRSRKLDASRDGPFSRLPASRIARQCWTLVYSGSPMQ
jgi:hypothetical protein